MGIDLLICLQSSISRNSRRQICDTSPDYRFKLRHYNFRQEKPVCCPETVRGFFYAWRIIPGVRYRTDQGPNEVYPYSESMHQMLTLTMVLSIVIAVLFIVAGTRGKIMWMRAWGVFLLLLASAYLVADWLGYV